MSAAQQAKAETGPVRLIRDMSHAEVLAAVEMTYGRNWRAADFYGLTDCGDCARAEVYWSDGAADYVLHDSVEEAVEHLRSMGAAIARATGEQQ